MNTRSNKFIVITILCLTFMACGSETVGSLMGNKDVVVNLVYGSEKQEWLEPLVAEYNAANNKTADGSTIVIEAKPMGSIEAINAIIGQEIQPVVWSPASSVYLPVAEARWQEKFGHELAAQPPADLVLSPVVIAMWQPMAEALGWPTKPIGWSDISELAVSEDGWAAYGYPEWGKFKFGHTHPDFSNSGLVAILAQAYAGAGKQRGLTPDDLLSPELAQFMEQVESSIIHYGSSTGFFADTMFNRGPSYLSATVMYENLVVAQKSKRLSGASSQIPVVAIYPKEGTFWTNNPYVVLNAPWVSDTQKEAAEAFETFLLARPQQERAIALGFRPADPSIPLGSPLDAQHGVDPSQPQTVLEVPEAAVIEEVQYLWRQAKRPVDVTLVVDTSGSMAGDKITTARTSLVEFINQLSNRDRAQIVLFNNQVSVLSPLTPLADKREELVRRVSGIIEGGDTSLYDATLQAYQQLETEGDPDHIRAVVVLSDGEDTSSVRTWQEILQEIGASGEVEGGNSIKIFTIAFGSGADTTVLQQMAEPTGGKQFTGDPATIDDVYAEIALFF
ncbi:MAG: VWA domain-containing protein [Anaerolineaceae bacterium]|nr:VWA domain-containing protein [Anaerolineaceae bacterium]MCB9101789.1 VWA domain-containing protein [Anaerolineales bacterium]